MGGDSSAVILGAVGAFKEGGVRLLRGWLSLCFSAAIAVGLVAGCSTPHSQQNLMVAEAPNMPLSLKLIRELYNGHSLVVHSTISGLVGWERATARVRLRLYRDGELLTSTERSLGEGYVPPGEEVPFVIEVSTMANNATGFTDYQLELVWGDGEFGSPSKDQASVTAQNLTGLAVTELVSEVARQGCPSGVCGVVLRGNLRNLGKKVVEDSALRVGYRKKVAGITVDQKPIITIHQELSLAGINLEPGEVQPFEVSFDEAPGLIEELNAGNLEPFAEVLVSSQEGGYPP